MNLSILGGYDFKVSLGKMSSDTVLQYMKEYTEGITNNEVSHWYTFQNADERKRCSDLIKLFNRKGYWGSYWDDLVRNDFSKPFHKDEIIAYNGSPATLFGVIPLHEASILRVSETIDSETEHYLKLETTQRSFMDGYYIFHLKIEGNRCKMVHRKCVRPNDDIVYPIRMLLKSTIYEHNEKSVNWFKDFVIEKIRG